LYINNTLCGNNKSNAIFTSQGLVICYLAQTLNKTWAGDGAIWKRNKVRMVGYRIFGSNVKEIAPIDIQIDAFDFQLLGSFILFLSHSFC
jgi:hypothetical protein